MRRVVRIARHGKVKDVSGAAATAGVPTEAIDTTVALLQALIPLGLQAVAEALEAEVVALAGARYGRTGGRPGVVRWGQQPGSVYLADQKLPIRVPRVRDRAANREVSLTTYERLQVPWATDAGLFRKVLVGLTCWQYEACADAVPEAFGLSASSVSRRFIRARARHLQTLCERRLDQDVFVAVVLDGKTFAEDAMVIALGITRQGQKKILDEGLAETLTRHRLGLFPVLGVSLKTTNCLESLNAQLGQLTDKVDHWRTSDQKHRWVASALWLIEPRLRRIKGYRHLSKLQAALQTEIGRATSQEGTRVA